VTSGFGEESRLFFDQHLRIPIALLHPVGRIAESATDSQDQKESAPVHTAEYSKTAIGPPECLQYKVMRLGQIRLGSTITAAVFEGESARPIPDHTLGDLIRRADTESIPLRELAMTMPSRVAQH